MTGAMGGIDLPVSLLTAGAFLGSCGLMGAGLMLFRAVERKRVWRRLARLTGKEKATSSRSTGVTVRREVADSSIETVDKLIKRLMPRPALLRERLNATGKRISLSEYLLASLLSGLIALFVLMTLAKLSIGIAFLFSIAVAVALPYKAIGIAIAGRQRKFLSQFAEAIELIVRGLKSGVPVNESIRLVGDELPDPVGVEFREIMQSINMGQNFNEAFAAASKRIDLAEFRFFVIALSIQRETGGNLAETLENLATIVRKRKQMKLKIKALSSEARASAYILGSLPFLMFGGLSVMSPDYMGVLISDTRGHIIIGAALASLALGVGTMIKMGKFEI